DEPTGNLDSRTGQEILSQFDRHNEEGQTIVMVTHDPGLAERCKRIVRISDGRIVADGPSARMLSA
ncbi:MAG TPA: macrolide ABC transporter ATP-binding protein, partial [Planctomycetia bacterium]|nr:macrolide ABC transporter ATP-binding protein [Planctomycetia bacterium]